jgi:hypothetical protein
MICARGVSVYVHNTAQHKIKIFLNVFTHEKELKDACQWLDDWESYIKALPTAQQSQFLSQQTCEGLRCTMRSTLELTQLLLDDGFAYVLTGKFNQDPLEVRIIRFNESLF